MTERKNRRQRRAAQQTKTPSGSAERIAFTTAAPPSSPSPAYDLLATSLSAAVPLRVLELYQRGGPSTTDLEEARACGRVLAEHGDRLLFRSSRQGETARLFTELANAVGVLAFFPGGVPSLFGQCFDARDILSGFLGREEAVRYCTALFSHRPDDAPVGPDRQPSSDQHDPGRG